ncbi:MAG TPA: hypothetical protein VIA62_25715 [Thermoanaerobaculia bacterium]|nr:hypothetical protein [Thermoanaerobaculia bacterium]
MVRDGRAADLFELDAEAVGMFSLIAFIDPADLKGDEASFRVLQQPVPGFSSLESPPHDPSSRHVDESQSDRLRSILRDLVSIELLGITERRTDPVEAGLAHLALNQGRHGYTGLMAMPLQADSRAVPIFGGRRSRKEGVHALQFHDVEPHDTIIPYILAAASCLDMQVEHETHATLGRIGLARSP